MREEQWGKTGIKVYLCELTERSLTVPLIGTVINEECI